ncbi:MAG TPA: chaperone modulator CbpM [Stellaceae bacterium]|jgi:chaperone modulatory protein CbpM|nr:chaperone modulator CbpM [Stellaceae bacterium]
MITFEAVCRMVEGIEARELEHWIHEHWVLPESRAEGYVFHEIDVARVRLIVELRRDLGIGEDSMPVLLNLLDQLYAMRRRLKALAEAIDALPEENRRALRARLGDEEE